VLAASIIRVIGLSVCQKFQHIWIFYNATTSETSVSFYQTTQFNIPEDSHLHTQPGEPEISLHHQWHLLSISMTYRYILTMLIFRKQECTTLNITRLEVLTVVKMLMLVIWVVALCGLSGRYQRFGGTCCLHLQGWFLPTSPHSITT
jgi:hypothetical protein